MVHVLLMCLLAVAAGGAGPAVAGAAHGAMPVPVPVTGPVEYDAVVKAMHYSGTESIKYVVPPGAGGAYLINPFCIGEPEATGSYPFTVDVQSPASRVAITHPAVPGTVRTGRTSTSQGDLHPLHSAEDTSVSVEFQKYSKGRWRVRAVHLADQMHPRQASAWRTFWVKV
jgi:hypothetical protein